jgi:hypothetical protein
MGAEQSQQGGTGGPEVAVTQAPHILLDEDPKLLPGYFGVTVVGGEPVTVAKHEAEYTKPSIDPALLEKIKAAYQQGFDEGVETSDKIKKSIADGERENLREQMSRVNEKHMESAKKMVCRDDDGICY